MCIRDRACAMMMTPPRLLAFLAFMLSEHALLSNAQASTAAPGCYVDGPAPPTAVCEEKKGHTEAELPVTVHPHHLEVAAHCGGCWLSATPAVAASCLHPQPVVPSAPRSSVREPEQVTGCCCSLQALRQAANALRNLSTAANNAQSSTHADARARARPGCPPSARRQPRRIVAATVVDRRF